MQNEDRIPLAALIFFGFAVPVAAAMLVIAAL
jgi:hypothetical protein